MKELLKYKWYVLLAVVIGISGLVYLSMGEDEIPESIFPIPIEESSVISETSTIFVDVKGAVVKEGVYVLDEGSRVKDVIDLAGGFLNDANKNVINLAQILTDEMLLYIPFRSEEVVGGQVNVTIDDGKINLNTASQSELETLPGIGPSKALAIIDYRETNGGFQTIEDLKNIGGIGEKTFEKLKEQIKTK